jgi:hypothetical protein
MKTFQDFFEAAIGNVERVISYKMAKPHIVKGKSIPAGKAMAKRSSSSAGGDGGDGE